MMQLRRQKQKPKRPLLLLRQEPKRPLLKPKNVEMLQLLLRKRPLRGRKTIRMLRT